jgi:hypothetical protein
MKKWEKWENLEKAEKYASISDLSANPRGDLGLVSQIQFERSDTTL